MLGILITFVVLFFVILILILGAGFWWTIWDVFLKRQKGGPDGPA